MTMLIRARFNRAGTRDSGDPGGGSTSFQADRDTANDDLLISGRLDFLIGGA
ncbi:hypothetical protein [Neorhizobium sp. R1-B]|uniref:hypothetical protein n=1 Tax=Neorhizobium sp. R1-B TaxID=2485162 RepID=UPI001FE164F4|nr:hypothetical protein [Neorhizobium sp. R1-B]